jgi:GAF domain-containing protein
LNGKFFEEKEIIEESERTVDNSGLFNIYLLKCISAYIYIEEDKQFEFTEKLAKIFVFVPGSITTSYFVFLDSVILMSLLIKQKIPKSYFKRVKSNLKKLKKWAKYSAHNRLHHTYFIEALIFEYKGKTTEALDSFEKSIQKSHDIGFLMDEAIFAERAGRFCLSKNKKEIGIYFLSNAKNKYLRWGAQLKVNLLDREFPFLQTSSNHNTTISTHITTVLDKTHQEQTNFDLNTVQKFSRVISGEIEIEKLLSKVLHMILQNSGADFACILLEENNNLNIEAQMGIDGIIHFSKKNLDESKTDLPQSIIRTVFNRNEPVLLNQATIEGSFTEDPFIQSNKILSLLCVPINNQGKTIGILYLHNQIVKGVFNRNRIEILDMIISQSAISIANAKLYNTLEQKVQLRTLELESTNQKLKNLNQETANLNQLLNSLNKELDLKEILEKIYQYISSRYQLKYYALYLISPDQKYIKVKYWNFYKDVPNEFLEDFQNQQIGVIGTKGAHALAIHSRDAKVFHHIRLTGITPEERRNIDFFNIKTFLTIPIYLENKPLGMLDFFSEAKLKISKSDLSSISILGKQLSGIINNAKLYEETIQAKREIEQANFELKSTQEALSRAERSASINSMVSHLAHEVNNPLNYISTGEMITKESVQDAKAFILAAIPESPESKPFVEKIHSLFGEIDLGIKQTEKGRSRIKDTIQEIRAITGVDGIHVDNIDLIPILYSNWELTCEKNQIQAGLVSLVVNGVVWPQKFIQPTVVLSQKYIFSRAIRTLLNNSIYFAKMNPNPKIQIDLQKIQSSQENFISISIRNNGPSIEDGKESKIFDLKSSKYFGTELIGLPFVKEILQSVQCNLSLTDNGRNSGWVEFQIVMKDFV